MIEIEVQNETRQTQETVRFAAVPRIGEGVRLQDPDGFWVSYDVVDLWYQKAEFGEIWMPYIHVRMTPSEISAESLPRPQPVAEDKEEVIETAKKVARILQANENA
ncbi:hypothetical protein EDF56_10113 [Novosphingobium sp. PhB165]|uniref:hypothetical protein n=1 Tax=Novosphingobium sp. PhB165 TaxID=2485105 RepID=UPI0010D1A5E9|nr:hypothetical protein [Novosphingobium sp. PhB165]TCM21349.1 hypothetical protein EDF56_10113 [Novosphingobium sp. PhB165]